MFENEENAKEFAGKPRKYLKDKPRMPSTYNIAILGPHSSGKNTMAKRLSKRYGWKVINLAHILE
jgi:nicotinamide riboside kinase